MTNDGNRCLLRWGLVGCGDVARNKGGPALYSTPGCSLVAVMSRNEERAASFARRHGARRYYANYEELLADPEVNAIYVATPPNAHGEPTIDALRAGKHVLCEKPMGLTLEECDRMIRAAEHGPGQLMIAYYRRKYPAVVKIKELLDQGAVGQMTKIRTEVADSYKPPADVSKFWRLDPRVAGGGFLWDVGCHRLDLMVHFAGEAAEVSAFLDTLAFEMPVEDSASVMMRFQNGVQGTGIYHWNVPSGGDTIEIGGTKGRIVCDLATGRVDWTTRKAGKAGSCRRRQSPTRDSSRISRRRFRRIGRIASMAWKDARPTRSWRPPCARTRKRRSSPWARKKHEGPALRSPHPTTTPNDRKHDMKAKLAIHGGEPVRSEPWTTIYPPYSDQVEKEVEAAARIIRSRLLCAEFGPEVRNFEEAYAEYLGVKHAIAVSTGTAALVIALQALGVGLGDEVIVPAYTFLATGTCVLQVNGVPVFADIDPRVQGIDLEQVMRLTTPRTKAIIPVHANGYPIDMDPLMAFAKERGIAVIEDAAHSHGAECRGRKTGAIGDINAFSFQQKKNLPLGEGGMITTNDDDLAEKARQNRTFGKNVIGNNLRMNELHAAIGKIRLADLDRQNEFRIENAEYLREKLQGIRGITTQKPLPDTKCVYYNFMIRYEPETLGVSRNRFMEALNAEGIVAGSLYYPLYRNWAFRRGAEPSFYRGPESQRPSYADGTCPRAEEYCDNRNIEIKTFFPNREKEMNDVALAVAKVVENIEELKAAR